MTPDDMLRLFDYPGSARTNADRPARGGAAVTDSTLAPDAEAIELFWTHVVSSATCRYWVGAVSSPDGYGRFTFRRRNRQRSMSAHRFALTLAHPDLRAGMRVGEHVCNEPLCVRVDDEHVVLGTQAHNLAYAVGLGRHRGALPTTTIDRSKRSLMVRQYLLDGGEPDQVRVLFAAPSCSTEQLKLF